MDDDLLISFDAALGNFCVIFGVAMVIAGPVFGLLIKRLHEEALDKGFRFMAIGALFLFSAPLSLMGQLITNPELSLVDHRQQAQWGLLIGLLVLVSGGIAVAIEGRRRAK